ALREVEIAAHGALGDLRHFLVAPGGARELVDHLDGDHGGIHVQDGEAPAPPAGGRSDREVVALLAGAPQQRGPFGTEVAADPAPDHLPPPGARLDPRARLLERPLQRLGLRPDRRHLPRLRHTASPAGLPRPALVRARNVSQGVRPMSSLLLDGSSLTLEQLERIAHRKVKVGLAPQARARLAQARALVDRIAAGDAAAYGINTGFGNLAEVRIAKEDLGRLQRNLILSHAAGVGEPLSLPETRALLALRANVLAKGHSGIRPETVETLLAMLAADVLPVVPSRGSVGASGDLAPLAHLALGVIGEGEVFYDGTRMPAREALARAGIEPVELQAKEGLALINGTQAICAVGGLAAVRAQRLLEVADVAGAMTVEALRGSHRPFIEAIHRVRPQIGQQECADHLRRLLADSEIVHSHANCKKVQDAYSLRCMPQVHGAARDGVRFAVQTLSIEINS